MSNSSYDNEDEARFRVDQVIANPNSFDLQSEYTQLANAYRLLNHKFYKTLFISDLYQADRLQGQSDPSNVSELSIDNEADIAWLNQIKSLDKGLGKQAERVFERYKKLRRRLDKLITISDRFQKVLQVSMQNKDRFVANLSHELRNPLGTIVGVTEELAKSDLNDDQVQLIDVLQQSSQSLLDVINEVLDLSRIQSGQSKTALNKFDLDSFLHSFIEQFQYHRFRRNVELNLTIDDSVPKYIISDEHRIKQILMNLVSNALKFTEQGSVSLHTSLVDDDLLFEVIDTGIGIEQERINKLFRRFVQEDDTISSRYGGTGLGLSIVHELTQLLGGTVSVKSKKGEGSVFTLRLPFQSIAQTPNDKVISNTINLEPLNTKDAKRILFIDDSKEQHWLLQRFLQSEPVQVVVATTGTDAVATFSNHDFDLAIIDLQLPDIDGFKILAMLRAMNSEILAIALSGQVMSVNEMRAAGFNDFLMKPYKKEELINTIHRLL